MYPCSTLQSERVYRALNPKDPFKYAKAKNNKLELIGLILWLTEGDKSQLSLANGSVSIIQCYLRFLREICGLREDKIKAVIHCHDSVPYRQCVRYWSSQTNIPTKRFNKPFIKKDKGGTRRYPYGIIRIVANNTKLVRIFNERLRGFNLSRD